ncbi:E7 [Capra hircus papillomavirus 1]|uniref:Protein E7 n=1 Tax=Capra hircus papillomavirus 1 TaxID=338903 RepID=Q1I126_9PAPI|nr:E7 [Capra hircus papillomavirus 1]AAZ39802.1 E7 [Capra hircus papillomavirus 1]
MIGLQPTLKDVELYPVDSIDLTCYETLSPEVGPEYYPYEIAGHCARCNRGLRLYVCTTRPGIRKLEQQLLDDLSILCGTCGRDSFQHGGKKA